MHILQSQSTAALSELRMSVGSTTDSVSYAGSSAAPSHQFM